MKVKKTEVLYKFKVPMVLYPSTIEIYVTNNIEGLVKELKFTNISDLGNTVALCNTNLLIFRKDRLEVSVIAHECLHAINKLFSYIGITYNTDNDEVLAYSVEFLISRVLKGLSKKYKVKIY